MRALLDTNVIIHRENTKATSFTIGKLFYWLDKLRYEKLIHPYSIAELRKYRNPQMQSLYDAKIDAYTEMRCIAPQTAEFTALLSDTPKTANDQIDNQLLCELYCKRADILITEDRRMRLKADRLGLSERVFTINSFIEKCTNENPDLIDYKVLAVKKELFGNINVADPFFATFREAYTGFENWFIRKSNEEAYVCRTDTGAILGSLYLKTETEEENYSDIAPVFRPKRRLKVGTFKVEASGFRLGERFIKIIFDNAIERNVEEIYVTLFMNRPELRTLYGLLIRWGFYEYGIKKNCNGEEVVLVKKMAGYDISKSVKENFPNIRYNVQKFFLPIEAQYHTPLFPDSQLRTEGNFDYLGDKAHRYALQKVYISLSYKRDMRPGDLLVIYRKGTMAGRKAYESVVSTICVVDEVRYNFSNKEDYLKYCENRTVFSQETLNQLWEKHGEKLLVVKFIFIKSLTKRITLGELWSGGIIPQYSGPRPFDHIPDADFDTILAKSQTKIHFERQ